MLLTSYCPCTLRWARRSSYHIRAPDGNISSRMPCSAEIVLGFKVLLILINRSMWVWRGFISCEGSRVSVSYVKSIDATLITSIVFFEQTRLLCGIWKAYEGRSVWLLPSCNVPELSDTLLQIYPRNEKKTQYPTLREQKQRRTNSVFQWASDINREILLIYLGQLFIAFDSNLPYCSYQILNTYKAIEAA